MTLNAAGAVSLILQRVGSHLVIGTPLGIGKPIPLLDAIYRRARQDPSIRVEIITALTLSPPSGATDLERRLLDPIAERTEGWVAPAYLSDLEADRLPDNVSVSEFYLAPGNLVQADAAQRQHINANYSDVVRACLNRGVNVIAQSVAVDPSGRLSLSSNPDVTLDLMAHLAREDRPTAMVAVINDRLPFVGGDAVIPHDSIDIIVDGNREGPEPFPVPSEPVSLADHAVGLQAAALIRDGGTIQLGIGSMSDAVASALILRDQNPEAFQWALDRLGVSDRNSQLVDEIGGTEAFTDGLYVCSEMLSDALLGLYDKGIVRRPVFPNKAVQQLVDSGELKPSVTPETLHRLEAVGVIHSPLEDDDLALLVSLGLISGSCELTQDGQISLPDGREASAELAEPGTAEALVSTAPGDRLPAPVVHAAFFLGSAQFYQRLREIDPASPDINMTGVGFTNSLDRFEDLKRAQRRSARFVNQAMKVAGDGSIAAHMLTSGRTLSGVGGQFDFVDMARRLDDGRSITLLTSTRSGESNVVPQLPHVTIPGQHSDLVITEYGIANLQDKSAAEVMGALIEVCQLDFQEEMVEHGAGTGKLPAGYEPGPDAQTNHPDWLEERLAPLTDDGLLPRFPFGTELTEIELGLITALRTLESMKDRESWPGAEGLRAAFAVPEAAAPYLSRMGLHETDGLSETMLQRGVVAGLVAGGVIETD